LKNRLAIAFALAALIVAALGSTSAGQAAGGAVRAGLDSASSSKSVAGPLATQAPALRGPRGYRGYRGYRGLRGVAGLPGAAGAAGAAGPAGAQGVKGDTGTTGPPGPTASASAAHTTCCPDSTFSSQTMVGLASVNTTTSGQLTTTSATRVFAQAVLNLRPIAGATADARCYLMISNGTGPDNGLTSMSTTVYTNIPGATGGSGIAVPLAGSKTLAPGTYNVVAQCDQNGPTIYEWTGGNLNVWAIGT
jgi:hypothetical protein